MQTRKIEIFFTFFLRYIANLGRYWVWVINLLGLGTLGMPGQTHQKDSINLRKTMFISMRKINFITHLFPEILQRYCIVILNILGMPLIMPIKYDCINLSKTLTLICSKKSTSSFIFFLKYCKDFANLLFWVLWAWLALPTKTDSVNF